MEDSDYIRKLDSLARFYNSQITSHVGYLLTSAAGYFAIFSLATQANWIPEAWSLALFVVVGVLYFALPAPFPPFPMYLLARVQYYNALSQVVWDHMGSSSPDPTYFERLKQRALQVPRNGGIGIQQAVGTLFEAHLYLSYHPEKRKDDCCWKKIFNLQEFSREFTVSSYDRNLFGVLKLSRLLMVAYRGTLKSYLSPKNEDVRCRMIGALFEEDVNSLWVFDP